MSKNKLQKLNY